MIQYTQISQKQEENMIIYDIKTGMSGELDIPEKTVVALGNFDGCHAGHISVITEAKKLAVTLGAKVVVYTFDNLTKGSAKSIFTLSEKIKAISALGVNYIALENFENVKELSGEVFAKDILINKLHAIGAVCGFNYRFGKGASYDALKLKEFFEKDGLCVRICDKICIGDDVLSSSLIRGFIEGGEIEKLLDFGHPYSIYAKVVHGKMLGRTIGIPTINQFIPNEKVVPLRGVYFTECEIGEDVYPSITNVGIRPTVENVEVENIETHIIGFDNDLYGSFIRVNFYKFIRGEKVFESVDELKEQIQKDIKECKRYFCIN